MLTIFNNWCLYKPREISVLQFDLPKLWNPVKCQEIGIMVVVGSALAVLKSGPGQENDIFSLKHPVNILKSMVDNIRMLQKNFS